MKQLVRQTLRETYRRIVPAGAKNTLRQWLLFDEQDKPPTIIEDFSGGPVLVIAPHMDDEVVGCGGTLRRHVLADAPVHAVFLTDGSKGNPDLYRDDRLDAEAIAQAERELVEIRKQESRDAARVLGVTGELVFLDGPDGALAESDKLIQQLAGLIDRLQPTIIYVPSVLDRHPDHWAANRIFHATLGRLAAPLSDGTRLRQCEAWTPLLPNRVVAIDHVLADKRRALEAFPSQLRVMDLVHSVLGLNAYRSIYPFMGRGHAEAFFESTPHQYREFFDRFMQQR